MKKRAVLGLSCYYHDSAACIIVDGKIVAAAAEERFSRKKHDNGFPFHAITYCLDTAGLAINELENVVFYEKPILKFERIVQQHLEYFPLSYKTFLNTMHSWFNTKLQLQKTLKEKFSYCGELLYINHHLSHAASSYYLSGFKDAVVVTLDGVGEWATTAIGKATGTKIQLQKEIDFPHSLGLLYSTITSYLGFTVNDAEYKVMGLAAYGNPQLFAAQFDELIKTHADGSYELNLKYFDYGWSDKMFSRKLEKLFGYPARQPESAAPSYYEDIAAALQAKLEAVVFNLLSADRKYKSPRLCMAGGISLNSVMNGKILKNTPFTDVFIPPDPSDAGGAMGAAMWAYLNLPPSVMVANKSQKLTKNSPEKILKSLASSFQPYLGPSYNWSQISFTIKKRRLPFELINNRKKLLDTLANALINQKVIGWFQGGMEWGPRALGARSILASASQPEMKDIINARVKHRELFRPFAPAILEESASKYFYSDKHLSPSAQWMLMVYPFKKNGIKEAPAVVHVDNTGRLQTVKRKANPLYYDLIKEFGRRTGTPMIINTSFNVRGEPIVCSPDDAINCFLATDIDILVLDQYVIYKEKIKKKKKHA